MNSAEAIRWLQEVNGQLFRNQPHPGRRAWVAVVRARRPDAGGRRIIIALGSTLEEATAAAQKQWSNANRSHSHQ